MEARQRKKRERWCEMMFRRAQTPAGIYQVFARNLVAIRKANGLKAYVAAVNLGVHKSTWSQWESAKRFPSGDMLALIAAYFHVSPCTLLCPDEIPCPVKAKDLGTLSP